MGPRLVTRERCWWLACELVFLNAIVSLTVPRGSVLTAFGDVIQCFLLTTVLACIVANTRTSEQRSRLFWIMMSLGTGLWLCAQVLWTYFEVFLRREVPNPFVGDVILFLHLAPMMAALAMQPHLERSDETARLGMLDLLLLVTWWLYLYCFVVIPWQYIWPNAALYGQSFDLVYGFENCAFLACAALAWWRASGNWKATYGHLFGAGMLYALGSITSGVAIDFGRYYTGSVYDIPLVGSMCWFAALGWTARNLSLRTEPYRFAIERRALWVSGLAMGSMLSLPAMAAWTLYVSRAPASVRSFRLLLTLLTMMIMGTLTWIKLHRSDKALARINRELREDSLTDPLTGARNRRFFTSSIEADLQHVTRAYTLTSGPKRNRDLAFYLIDTDSFKEVNDRHGHDMGDRLLIEIAHRISSAIRYSDALIRWGGDEFLVVSRYTDRNDGAILASRILKSVGSEPYALSDQVNVRCSCSIGWAVFPWYARETEKISCDEILKLADSALYEAKKGGRNQAVGMLPTREEPVRAWASKTDRMADQLSARTVITPGPPQPTAADTAPSKAASASAGA